MSDLTGLVLAGGRSKRMGTDKGLLQFHGQPQRSFLFNLLGNFCSRVYTSCRSDQIVAADLNPIIDVAEMDSPLIGLVSAFRSVPPSAWLTVPVDMPGIQFEAISYLIQHRDRSCHATCFLDSEGTQPEPLVTIWERHALTDLFHFFDDGGFSPRLFLQTHSVCLVEAPTPEVLLNVNSEEEYRKWIDQHSNPTSR